jgi:hypothetical protein
MVKKLVSRTALVMGLTCGAAGLGTAASIPLAPPASASASCGASTHNHWYNIHHYIYSVERSGRYNIVTWHTAFIILPYGGELFYDRHYTTLWCLR